MTELADKQDALMRMRAEHRAAHGDMELLKEYIPDGWVFDEEENAWDLWEDLSDDDPLATVFCEPGYVVYWFTNMINDDKRGESQESDFIIEAINAAQARVQELDSEADRKAT